LKIKIEDYSNGKELYEDMIEGKRFDIILLDIEMGKEVCIGLVFAESI
jgi:hypothetical protein